jgi:hypothetical protein
MVDADRQREAAAVTVSEASTAGIDRLNDWNREMAFQGTSLILMDPRDLAGMLERLANAARLESLVVTWDSLVALALAGRVAAAHVEEMRVDTGEAA